MLLLPWPTAVLSTTDLEIRALPVSQSGLYAVLVLNNDAAAGVSISLPLGRKAKFRKVMEKSGFLFSGREKWILSPV